MQCITSVTYSYLINDAVYGKVTPYLGIRQGDPISSYLFILCGEVLSGLCRNAELEGSLRGVRIARGCPRVNHLLFADDTMLFWNSSTASCLTLIEILQAYENVSGKKVNIAKSSITFSSKTPPDINQAAKDILGIQKEGGVGKYLGLPEHFGRKKRDLFTFIVDMIQQRAANWSTRFLSRAEKLTMLKAVLTAIPTYAMSCFQLPVSLCKRIQSSLTRFWWDKSADKKSMCWLVWGKLTKPKSLGGLGLRDIQLFNQALLAKIAWHILTSPQCLLARVLKGKYYHKKSFLDAPVPTVCSHGWRSILHGRDLPKENLGKAIGNGQSTRVWKDSWISTTCVLKPCGPIHESALDLRVLDLLTDDLHWNKDRIKLFLPGFSSQIQCIWPSKAGAEDSFVWLPLPSGVYSTKSGYNSQALTDVAPLLRQSSTVPTTSPEFHWLKDVWSVKTAPKLKLFLWSMIQGALPVGSELQRRGMLNAAPCPRCKDPETSLHVFFLFPFAKAVWERIPLRSPPPTSEDLDIKSVLTHFRNSLCLPPSGIRTPILSWICWYLWLARNRLVFENKTLQPQEVATKGIAAALEWNQAQDIDASRDSLTSNLCSRDREARASTTMISKPSCSTYAAWDIKTKQPGVGWVISDVESTNRRSGSAAIENVASPLMAEALSLYTGIKEAKELGLSSITLLSDCATLIRAISSRSQIT